MNIPKYVLVTGASRGIGRETALCLLQQGVHVIALARTESRLQDLKKTYPTLVTVLPADLTNPDTYPEIYQQLQELDISLDAIIHNAGALLNKPFLDTTTEDWNYLIQANFMSSVNLIKTCHPYLKKGSHVVQIGSMGGFQGSSKFPGLSGYSVTKGTLSILAECLAVEFAKDDIRINCLCLGAVQTEMLEAAFPGLQAPVDANEMGLFITDFALNAQKYFNGKVLPVSLTDPT